MTDPTSATPVAPSALHALIEIAHGPLGWLCQQLEITEAGALVVHLLREAHGDTLRITAAVGDLGGAQVRTRHCALRYEGRFRARDGATRDAVRNALEAVGAVLDDLVDSDPRVALSARFWALRVHGSQTLSRAALSTALTNAMPLGAALPRGWVLADISEPEQADRAGHDVVLDFTRPSDEARVLLRVDGDPSGGIRVSQQLQTWAPLETQRALSIAVAFCFAEATFAAPADGRPGGGRAPTPRDAQKTESVLLISAPCQQSCEFCTIQQLFSPTDGGDDELSRLVEQLARDHAAGARAVRLTGIDPLAFSRVVPLMARATALGYERAYVHSPCTTLADAARCDELLAAMPAGRFMVPLYALAADVHDRIVGRDGAYALVRAALDHLITRAGASAIAITTVCLPGNLSHLAALARFAEAHHIGFQPYLPFPDRDSLADRFQRVSLPQATVMAELRAGPDPLPWRLALGIAGLAPCVVLRHAKAREPNELAGLLALLASPDGRRPVAVGSRTTHVACAHAATCSLVPPCDGTVLRAYVRKHGTDELGGCARPGE